jgi:signal transduction histidine kinase
MKGEPSAAGRKDSGAPSRFKRLRLSAAFGAAGVGLVAFADILTGDLRSIWLESAFFILLAFLAAFGTSPRLRRFVPVAFPTIVFSLVFALLVRGDGLHDAAILGLPVTIVVAALFLGKRGVVVFTGLSMLSAAIVSGLELSGLAPAIPGYRTGWGPFAATEVSLPLAGFLLWIVMRDLEAGTGELREAEARLVENEKLGTLGRVSAGIAHQINSPLGAIVSASASILENLGRFTRQLEELFDKGSPRDKDFFLRLIAGRDRGEGMVTRDRRKLLEARLTSLGVLDAPELAERLLELGIGDSGTLIADLIRERPTVGGAAAIEAACEHASIERLASVLNESALRSHQVVEALRTYTETAEATGQEVELDLRQELRLSVDRLSDRIGKDIELRFECDEGLRVRGRAARLQLVWSNIITNAVDAMAGRGTLVIRATEGAGAASSEAILEFEDSGRGIAPEHRDSVFKPFFTTKRLGAGLGLGLDIVRRVVEDHRGSIDFDSEPGKTVFRVRLPLVGGSRPASGRPGPS